MMSPVVNATGVLLHTNLGRSPFAFSQRAAYRNIEYDLVAGKRGSRQATVGQLLASACGAEASIVVNNGAAAVLLVMQALASEKEVVVSRGELIEIGGHFRIPDVLTASGARLKEVGTTNKTRLDDYRTDSKDVALLLKVHRSNFTMNGFTEDVPVEDLCQIGPPVVVDLGSGLLDETCPWLGSGPPNWLRGEPGVRQTLANGASLVTFSGDKLMGGPQAGIIAGRADLVNACAQHPLYRALRPGTLTLEAVESVAMTYLSKDADQLTFWSLATTPSQQLVDRAAQLAPDRVVRTKAVVGGGTLPGAEIPSIGVALPGDQTAELRSSSVPIIARVSDSQTILDLRSVLPDQDPILEVALTALGARPA